MNCRIMTSDMQRFVGFISKQIKLDYTWLQSLRQRQNFVIYHSWPVGLMLKSGAMYVYLVKSGGRSAVDLRVRCQVCS